MRFISRFRAASLSAVFLVLFSSASFAQSPEELACRSAMAKNVGKFVSVVFRDLTGCHKRRSAGKIPADTNCNDVFTIPRNHAVAAYQKATTAILAACPDTLTGVLSQYARCPSPHSNLDDDNATSGIDNFDEATACVLNLAATIANGAAATVLGHSGAIPGPALAKCQATLGTDLRKRVNTIAKARSACQATLDSAGGGLGYDCANSDDGSIASNLVALAADVSRSCALPQSELIPLDSCGQTAAQIADCVGLLATRVGGGLVAEAYELPSTCKLGSASLTLNAGAGIKRTSTHFEVGYNGLGLGVDLLDNFKAEASLDCDDDCVGCVVRLDPLKGSPLSYCRCDSDPTVHCDTINGADADDCGGGTCNCMFGPPLPLLAAGVPACVVNRFASDLDGFADGGTGVATTTIANRGVVHLGESIFTPCPVCEGDSTADDGVRDGTCSAGSRSGLSCDENGRSPDFGPLSFDCPPSVAQNVSGAGLEVSFALTSVEAPSLAANLLDHSVPVFCLQCSGNTSVGCSSNEDCAALGFGTCTANTSSQAHVNACDDGICTVTSPTEPGTCAANAPDHFCDGILRMDGNGIVPCDSNADCNAYDSVCPGGSCGTCSASVPRACFPDPIQAVGSDAVSGAVPAMGVYGADMVATFCVPPTVNASINQSVGLPGPGRLLVNFDFLGRCASDHSIAYDLPGGSNCP